MKQNTTYVYKIAIPANTTTESDSPIINGAAITGRLVKMHVDIPEGVQFSAGFRVEFITGLGAIRYPQPITGASDYFTGENTKLDLKPNIELKEATPKIYGVNNSSSQAHTMIMTIEVEQGE